MRGVMVNAQRLRQIRQARGLTQQQLAIRAGVGERTVRNAEQSRRIRLDFLGYLATVLGVEIADIINDRDEMRLALLEQRRVDHIFAAIEAHAKEGDQQEFFKLLSPHCVLNFPGPAVVPISGEYRGVDGLKLFFERSLSFIGYESLPEIVKIRTGGNLVVVSGVDRLRALTTGKTFSTPWTHIYEFENGHVLRLDNLCDNAKAQLAFEPG